MTTTSTSHIYLERYQCNRPIEPQEFYVYKIERRFSEPAVNTLSLARSIAGRINMSKTLFYAATDDINIYTKVALPPYYLSGNNGNHGKQTYCEYELNLQEKQIIPFQNVAVYEAYIYLLIQNKLSNYHPQEGFFKNPRYIKYVMRNREIHSAYTHLYENDGETYKQLSDKNYNSNSMSRPNVLLTRNYQVKFTMKEDGFFTVSVSTKVDYVACQSLYDKVHSGKQTKANLTGLRVKYSLTTGLNQTGTVVEEADYLAANPGKDIEKDASVEATLTYLQQKYPKNQSIQAFVQKDRQLRPDNFIVYVRLNPTTVYQYLASTLYPVLTSEYVAQTYPQFSKEISKYTKIAMGQRIIIDQEFLEDIGSFPELGTDIWLITTPRSAEEEGFKSIPLETPQLRIGNNKSITPTFGGKKALFQPTGGYYSIPQSFFEKNSLHINVLGDSSTFTKPHLVHLLRYLYKFGGLQYGSPLFAVKNPQNFLFQPHFYLTDYNEGSSAIVREIHKMNNESTADLNFIILDDYDTRLPANFHDKLKKELAWKTIPSQMVTAKNVWNMLRAYEQSETRRLSAISDTNVDKVDFKIPEHIRRSRIPSSISLESTAHNLVMQMLAKLGCIPGILAKPLPGNIDLVLGLDVGMVTKGIHYPGCSVMIDNQGHYLGSYAPNQAQATEKIPVEMLEEIFNRTLFFFEEQKGHMPSRVLIMRDGFSNEDDKFYANYFSKLGIQYDIVEVRKQSGTRLASSSATFQGVSFSNPETGTCIINNENEGFLITSEGHYHGAPRPLKIVHSVGELSMQDVMQICFSLTKIYPGSVQNIRLPYATYIADKICKAYDRVPHGLITDRNFFM